MAKLFPELVFIRGPQKGQRAPLSKTINIIGRDKTCDIDLQDEYASRQHARLIVEGARVRLVNVSPNGTRLNGKPVEQAVLNNGDVIGFGLECEAQLESADAISPARPGGVPPPLPGGKGGESASRAVLRPGNAAVGDGKAASPSGGEEPVPGKRKLKRPPAVVLVGIYLFAVAALIIFCGYFFGSGTVADPTGGEYLTKDRIAQLIRVPAKVDSKNPRLAAESLDQAVKGVLAWETNTNSVPADHLYLTYLNFKEALAYDELKEFDPAKPYHDPTTGQVRLYSDMMQKVEDELLKRITDDYENAYVEQRQGHWQGAQVLYHRVLASIGNDHQQDPIYVNVRKQLNLVNSEMHKQSAGPKQW